jgi:hemoglobin
MSDTASGPEYAEAVERAISLFVRRFYDNARQDALLGPVFAERVTDWEHHFKRIDNFWSHVLLGTSRYSGHPYPLHARLPVELEHFSRWLALFEAAARETLEPALAEKAIAKARHMSASFQAGIFPFREENGHPQRTPAVRTAKK